MNIAEILKDKPKGTKLYSPICGDCHIVKVHNNEDIEIKTDYDKNTSISLFFDKKGRIYLNKYSYISYTSPYGKCLLFPSEKMQDWNKFAWKKGDVLKYNNDSSYLIFEKFTDDSYTIFKWKHFIDFNKEIVFDSEGIASTEDYSLANRCSCGFIHYLDILERKYHGKFNIDTMEFDKVEPTWKKGDILVNFNGNMECIFKEFVDDTHTSFIGVHCFNSGLGNDEYFSEITLSTIVFKLQDPKLIPCYINTIEERFEGKLNMDTLQIEPNESIEPKHEFKPFDKVIVRREDNGNIWQANIFSHIVEKGYYACIMGVWSDILPYNEETAKLVGTTKDVEE